MTWNVILATVALTVAGASTLSLAQDGGQPNADGDRGNRGNRDNQPGGGGQGGQRGNWDPAEMQKRMNERIKEELKAPDDEWAVIEPKLTKVMTAQREVRAGGFGGFGGNRRGGPDQANNTTETSPLATASRELRTVLAKENASAEEIDQKLTAYRDARTKAQTALDAARKELKEVLTARQEATLVLTGMLD